MQLRNLAPATQRGYLHYVAGYAKYYNTRPEQLDLEAVRQYELHLLNEKKLSPESINQFVSAVKSLYLNTLEMPWGQEQFPRVRRPSKLPVVLSPAEVAQFFEHIPSLKYRAALMSCYGAGLRISEAVSLKISDIDSQRMLLHIEQGKGQKDRYAMLSPRLLAVLRTYWRVQRPRYWLFPSWRENRHLSAGSLQLACREACKSCQLGKRITAHTLRHRFATHLLENGTDIRVIQCAKAKCCWAIAVSIPRLATPPFLHKWLPARSVRWTASTKRGSPSTRPNPKRQCSGQLSSWPTSFDCTAPPTGSL